MSRIWRYVPRATVHLNKYWLCGLRLYDDFYCGEDGMSDCPCECPLDEWMVEVESWYDGLYGKTAGPRSDVRMKMTFTDRESANKMWSFIRNTEPSYATLAKLGFYRTP